MTEINDSTVDIPEPGRALAPNTPDVSSVDPGGDVPLIPSEAPGLGEDPAYDPGGMGRQPDVEEDEETYP